MFKTTKGEAGPFSPLPPGAFIKNLVLLPGPVLSVADHVPETLLIHIEDDAGLLRAKGSLPLKGQGLPVGYPELRVHVHGKQLLGGDDRGIDNGRGHKHIPHEEAEVGIRCP